MPRPFFEPKGEREPLALRATTTNQEPSLPTRWFELCPSLKSPVPLRNADKARKVPIKVDPKVFFANERTFLAWLHMALILGSIGLGLISFSEKAGWSAIYGFLLVPVAIAFVVYALWQYYARAQAIRSREPGPYEDINGPYALGIILICATISNVVIHITAAPSHVPQ